MRLHLADWIGHDLATGISLKDIEKRCSPTQRCRTQRILRTRRSTSLAMVQLKRRTYVTSKSVTVHLGLNEAADISHTVTRANGTTFSAQDLIDDAWNAWQMILRGRGLIN